MLNITGLLTDSKLCPAQASANARDYSQWSKTVGSSNAHAASDNGALTDRPNAKQIFFPKLPTR